MPSPLCRVTLANGRSQSSPKEKSPGPGAIFQEINRVPRQEKCFFLPARWADAINRPVDVQRAHVHADRDALTGAGECQRYRAVGQDPRLAGFDQRGVGVSLGVAGSGRARRLPRAP
jgi:hypothetical protein